MYILRGDEFTVLDAAIDYKRHCHQFVKWPDSTFHDKSRWFCDKFLFILLLASLPPPLDRVRKVGRCQAFSLEETNISLKLLAGGLIVPVIPQHILWLRDQIFTYKNVTNDTIDTNNKFLRILAVLRYLEC